MGDYTTNSHFYLPSLGHEGQTEKDTFDAALESADVNLQKCLDATQDGVEIKEKTLSEMSALTDSLIRLVIITDRVSGQKLLELWSGSSFIKRI